MSLFSSRSGFVKVFLPLSALSISSLIDTSTAESSPTLASCRELVLSQGLYESKTLVRVLTCSAITSLVVPCLTNAFDMIPPFPLDLNDSGPLLRGGRGRSYKTRGPSQQVLIATSLKTLIQTLKECVKQFFHPRSLFSCRAADHPLVLCQSWLFYLRARLKLRPL